ncbi:hypothetical protein DH2020_033074 [Rehmannia glutinosa]|uniref:Major facilitator superfamily (MFS) profile domain-containing protein n=1 Tax=Rehmannia glutinosa TaxID=99300 RepID=A0ABR0VGF4_REHGL
MAFVDRFGRRRLMIVSMFGIIVCLIALSVLFYQASTHAPAVSSFESQHFGRNSTCGSFLKAYEPSNWNLSSRSVLGCNGCYKRHVQRRASDVVHQRLSEQVWFFRGSATRIVHHILLARMGTALDCQLEIYPLKYRGIGGGIAAVSNWVSNLIVSETFLTLTEALGSSGTFLLFAGFSTIGLVAIYFLVPETKGLPFEEVEKMLEKGFKPSLCGNVKEDDSK